MDDRGRSAALRSFNGFVKRTNKQRWTQAFRRAALVKWERKFDARLYQTWEYLKEQQRQKAGLQ